MMELTIEFSGLCALVRPARADQPLFVVLPTGTHDHDPDPGPHGPGTHGGIHGGTIGHLLRPLDTGGPHDPLLELPGVDVPQTAVQQYVPPGCGGPERLDLTGYEVSILAGDVPLSGAPELPPEVLAGHLARITNNGQIQLASIHVGRPLPPNVSTRIILAGGSIAYALAPAYSQLWGFDPPVMQLGEPYRQQMADRVTYRLVTAAAPIQLKLRRPKGGEERTIVLPDRGPARSAYHLKVTNLPRRKLRQEIVNGRVVASHFAAFYALLQAPPADPPLPMYEGPPPHDLDRETFCPLAMFEPPI